MSHAPKKAAEEVSSLRRGNFTYFPVAPGRVEFSIELRRAILKQRPRVVAVPVSADEAIIGAIRAEQSSAGSDARTRRIVLVLGSLAVGVVAVGAGIGYVIAGRLARPVRDLRDAAVRLGDGDFSLDVPRSDHDAVAFVPT